MVVWLTPVDGAAPGSDAARQRSQPELVQRNKSFEPHVIVVQVGSLIQFPNKDPFFHNIFSMYDGKRFDLGAVRSGHEPVRALRPAGNELFILQYSRGNERGGDCGGYALLRDIRSRGTCGHSEVPDGRYQMHVWYERSLPENLKGLTPGGDGFRRNPSRWGRSMWWITPILLSRTRTSMERITSRRRRGYEHP